MSASARAPAWLPWCLGALACFGVWSVLPKAIGEALSAREQQLLSTLGLVPVLLVLLGSPRLREGRRPRRGLALAAGSGLLTGAGNLLYYRATAGADALSSVAPLTALYPLVTVLLAAALLKERWSAAQAAGIVLSLAAMALFNFAGGVSLAGLDGALAPLLLWGAAGVLQKMAAADASGELAAVGFLAAFVPLGGAIWALSGALRWQAPASAFALAVLLGVLLAVGNLCLLLAYRRHGQASIVTPLSGLYWLVAVPVGTLAFGERVGPTQALALALTVVAVVALARERPAPEAAP